ncbi:MAG: AAA family ATPase [Enterovibrio sp.]
MIISFLSQKGGVGKSSLARTVAVEFTRAGWRTLLADIDSSQATSNRWAEQRRTQAAIKPEVRTQVFATTHQALTEAKFYDLLIIDGAPHSTRGTLEAALHSDLVVIPTGTSLDDLEPSILLANELANSLISEKIVFALYKTTSSAQERESRETITNYGYEVLDGAIYLKTGYITAFDAGYCATETKYAQLNKQATKIINSIAARVGA